MVWLTKDFKAKVNVGGVGHPVVAALAVMLEQVSYSRLQFVDGDPFGTV